MSNDKKQPSAIPSKAFPTAPTQAERAQQGIPPQKQPPVKSQPKKR